MLLKNKIFCGVINKNYMLLHLYFLLNNSSFIIFIPIDTVIKKLNFKALKFEIERQKILSLFLNTKYINKVFKDKYFFYGKNIYAIFFSDINEYIKFLKFFDNLKFYFVFNKSFSNLVDQKFIIGLQIIFDNWKFLQFLILKIICNIYIYLFLLVINIIYLVK